MTKRQGLVLTGSRQKGALGRPCCLANRPSQLDKPSQLAMLLCAPSGILTWRGVAVPLAHCRHASNQLQHLAVRQLLPGLEGHCGSRAGCGVPAVPGLHGRTADHTQLLLPALLASIDAAWRSLCERTKGAR